MLILPWHITGHHKLLAALEKDLRANKLSHTNIIEGASQTGKFSVLKRVAQFMHCENEGCLICNDCQQIENENHIGTFMFRTDSHKLGIKEFRELQNYLNLSAHKKYKIVLIQNIERLSIPLQNAMLKVLEEPPEGVYFFMTSANLENVLPTIKSRARVYKTGLASNAEVEEFLEKNFKGVNPTVKQEIVFFSVGRIGLAYELMTNEEKYQNRINWLAEIKFLDQEEHEFEALKYAEKLAALEKSEIFDFLQLLIQFYRIEMLQQSGKIQLELGIKIEKCLQSIDLISSNVNVKMCLEVLFLHCFTRLGKITSQ